MEAVSEFRYLGRILTAMDDDWPAVTGNIRKARVSWGSLVRVLGREGADPKVSRSFYTAVTQQVLLLPSQNPRQTSPAHPRLLDVTRHRRPVIARCCEEPPKVAELRHRLHRFSVGVERPL